MKVQVTLVSTMGYRAVTTVIDVESAEEFNNHRKQYIDKAVAKMCTQRGWTSYHLTSYGYTRVKCREYDKEKIEREKKERYEEIKKERGWK